MRNILIIFQSFFYLKHRKIGKKNEACNYRVFLSLQVISTKIENGMEPIFPLVFVKLFSPVFAHKNATPFRL